MEQKQKSEMIKFGCLRDLNNEHVEIRKALGEISSETTDNMFSL